MRCSIQTKYKLPPFFSSLALFLVITLLVGWFIENTLKPTLLSVAEIKAVNLATTAINEAIRDEVMVKYTPKDLLTVQTDHQGRVAFIQPNTVALNNVSADTVLSVQDRLKQLEKTLIEIPLGQLSGSQLLAGFGPVIGVKVVPMGTVDVKLEDTFTDAGINQTKHTLCLKVRTQIHIVIPLIAKTTNVETSLPVAEYVVVGEVPNTYLKIPLLGKNE